jgi:hypothetical protein
MLKRFNGQFDALTKTGADYCNHQRFRPLTGKGKPLWEFKEHDHRLYCFRRILRANLILVVLFNGWIKDKEGKTDREKREIEKAIDLYTEFSEEFPGR